MRKKYTEADRQAVIDLRKQGKKLQEIADLTGTPFRQVRKILDKADVKLTGEQLSSNLADGRKQTMPEYRPGLTEDILKLQRQGVSRPQIAIQLGVDINKVHSDIQRHSDYMLTPEQRAKTHRQFTEDQYTQIENLRRSGSKLREISEQVGMSLGTVDQYLRKNAICPEIPVPRKYSEDQRSQVIAMRQGHPDWTRDQIADEVGAHKSFVKKVLESSETLLTPQQRQENAYRVKLEKNPNAVADMRSAITDDHHAAQGLSLSRFYEDNPEAVAAIGARAVEWWDSLGEDRRREYLEKRGMARDESPSWQKYLEVMSTRAPELNPKTVASFKENEVSSFEELMAKYADKNRGKYLGGYVNSKTKCQWVCDKDHEFSMTPNNVRESQWCPRCAQASVSKECREVVDFIVSILPPQGKNRRWSNDQKTVLVSTGESGQTIIEMILNDRKMIGPKELDIWIPGKALAIEYNGIYYHSEGFEDNVDARTAHGLKYELCQAQGIRLVTIMSDEWVFRRAQVEGYFRAILGVKGEKLPARKLRLGKAPIDVVKSFIEEFHIQGAFGGVAYCLFDDNDRIVAAATFSKKKEKSGVAVNDWTLNRYCVRPDCNVPGGLGRLLKAFVTDYSPDKIVSFSDRRWSAGALYKALGFALTGTLPPDYAYFKNNTQGPRIHKFNFRRDKLISMGADPELTEWPMAQSVGLNRVWDCGKDRWELDFTEPLTSSSNL